MKIRTIIASILAVALIGFLLWLAPKIYEAPQPQYDISQEKKVGYYLNQEFGFSSHYPDGGQIEKGFSQYYHLPLTWRVGARPDASGTPMAAFPVFRVRQEETAETKTYPLYFSTELRIGASADPKEIARCLEADVSGGEQYVGEDKMNGLTYKKFSFADGGMMKYIKGISYRIIRNNQCYAIEAVAAGSIYRDETFEGGLTDQELDAYFQETVDLIRGFNFTR